MKNNKIKIRKTKTLEHPTVRRIGDSARTCTNWLVGLWKSMLRNVRGVDIAGRNGSRDCGGNDRSGSDVDHLRDSRRSNHGRKGGAVKKI